MMIQMRGKEAGKKLRMRKADLFHLRELFAEAAREQGVPLAASPRAARGVGRKGTRQVIYQLRQKGITPQVDRDAAREALTAIKTKKTDLKPWEEAMDVRHEAERATNTYYADRLRSEAVKASDSQREKQPAFQHPPARIVADGDLEEAQRPQVYRARSPAEDQMGDDRQRHRCHRRQQGCLYEPHSCPSPNYCERPRRMK